MSFRLLVVLYFFYAVVGVLSNFYSIIVPCKKNDEKCMTQSANIVLTHLADGIPSQNIEPTDPVHLSAFEDKVANLMYRFENSVVKGYTKCKIAGVKLNLEAMTLNFNVECPSLYLEGDLAVSGPLGEVTIEGNDKFKMICGKYLITIESNIEKVKGSDGEMHMSIKLTNVVGQPKEPIGIDYNLNIKENLPSESVDKMKEEKRYELMSTLTPPFLAVVFKQIFNSVNKHLESIPFDNLFLD